MCSDDHQQGTNGDQSDVKSWSDIGSDEESPGDYGLNYKTAIDAFERT